MKGRFIVFEGLDGSGKTTQMELVAEKLRSAGYNCITQCEPTDGAIGRLIRKALKGEEKLGVRALAGLFAADRSEHIDRLEKELEEDVIILCDRYVYSNFAYQGKDLDKEEILMYNSTSVARMLPDTVFFIDVSPEECMKRIEGNRNETEIYEKLDVLKKVREKYIEAFSSEFNKGVKVVFENGERPIDEIANEIFGIITKE